VGTALRFVHPLVRDAVYRQLAPAERAAAHARAASALAGEGDPIRVGLHLLEASPGAEGAVPALNDAARAAELDGAPESAAAFLARILAEPLEPAERTQALVHLGSAELRFDADRAARHLREAVAGIEDAVARADAALLLGRALYIGGRHWDSIATFERALAELSDHDSDFAYRLEAERVGPLSELREDQQVVDLLTAVHGRTLRGDGLGRRMLIAQLAASLAVKMPRAEYVRLARESTQDDLLLEDVTSDIYAWSTVGFSAADELEAARDALDRAVDHGRKRGSLHLLATALQFRARVHHLLGDLASAELDARSGIATLELHPLGTVERYLAGTLAEVLIARAETDEAASVLAALPHLGETPEAAIVLYSRCELALARGRPAEALALAEQLGRPMVEEAVWPTVGQHRWLQLQVEALAQLGRNDEASSLAEKEVSSARSWGAPRSLARALRIQALAAPPDRQLGLLEEARAVIDGSPALLERTHVLAALGGATRRAGRRSDARDLLREALELAHVCGAVALEQQVQDELVVAGARPRRVRLSGIDALTPSELRVARLAAEGRTNREIAQELFVTLKTIEMHLASCYRKLEISSRAQLPGALGPELAAAAT
jgi:DNA-binding CsgD family transcriptional regulator